MKISGFKNLLVNVDGFHETHQTHAYGAPKDQWKFSSQFNVWDYFYYNLVSLDIIAFLVPKSPQKQQIGRYLNPPINIFSTIGKHRKNRAKNSQPLFEFLRGSSKNKYLVWVVQVYSKHANCIFESINNSGEVMEQRLMQNNGSYPK